MEKWGRIVEDFISHTPVVKGVTYDIDCPHIKEQALWGAQQRFHGYCETMDRWSREGKMEHIDCVLRDVFNLEKE